MASADEAVVKNDLTLAALSADGVEAVGDEADSVAVAGRIQ